MTGKNRSSAVQMYDFRIFTVVYSSLHGFIWNQHNDQFPVGLLAQLVEHCTGIAEMMGSNPVQASLFSCLTFTTAQVVFITAKITFIFTGCFCSQGWKVVKMFWVASFKMVYHLRVEF